MTDAESMLELLLRLDEQTRFIMYEPGERSTSVERQAETLRTHLASGNSTSLLAEEDGRPVGSLEATGSNLEAGANRADAQTGSQRALYEKIGFTVEGTRKDAMRVEGSYIDEYYLAKLLG